MACFFASKYADISMLHKGFDIRIIKSPHWSYPSTGGDPCEERVNEKCESPYKFDLLQTRLCMFFCLYVRWVFLIRL